MTFEFKKNVDHFIRPPRADYQSASLGPSESSGFIFKDGPRYLRKDLTLVNHRSLRLRCTHWIPYDLSLIPTSAISSSLSLSSASLSSTNLTASLSASSPLISSSSSSSSSSSASSSPLAASSPPFSSSSSSPPAASSPPLASSSPLTSASNPSLSASSPSPSAPSSSAPSSSAPSPNPAQEPASSDAPSMLSRPCIVYAHGNSGSRLDAFDIVDLAFAMGASLFAFDFSGSGLSDGDFVSLGYHEVDDLQTVLLYLHHDPTVSDIALWGRSMGSVTVIRTVAKGGSFLRNVRCIIADTPFSTLPDLAHYLVLQGSDSSSLQKRFLGGFTSIGLKVISRDISKKAHFNLHDVEASVSAARCGIPALFFHGIEDKFVPQTHTLRVFMQYAGHKQFFIAPGHHNSLRTGGAVHMAGDFLYRHLQCARYLPQPPSAFNEALRAKGHAFLVKQLKTDSPINSNVILSLSPEGISLLTPYTCQVLHHFTYDAIQNFGHKQGNFVLRFRRTVSEDPAPPPNTAGNRLLFSTPVPQEISDDFERMLQKHVKLTSVLVPHTSLLDQLDKYSSPSDSSAAHGALLPPVSERSLSHISEECLIGDLVVCVDPSARISHGSSTRSNTTICVGDLPEADPTAAANAAPTALPNDLTALEARSPRNHLQYLPFDMLESQIKPLLEMDSEAKRSALASTLYKGTFSVVYNKSAMTAAAKASQLSCELLYRVRDLPDLQDPAHAAVLAAAQALFLITAPIPSENVSLIEFSVKQGHPKSPQLGQDLVDYLALLLPFLTARAPPLASSQDAAFPQECLQKLHQMLAPVQLAGDTISTLECIIYKSMFSVVSHKQALSFAADCYVILQHFLIFFHTHPELLEKSASLKAKVNDASIICGSYREATNLENMITESNPDSREVFANLASLLSDLLVGSLLENPNAGTSTKRSPRNDTGNPDGAPPTSPEHSDSADTAILDGNLLDGKTWSSAPDFSLTPSQPAFEQLIRRYSSANMMRPAFVSAALNQLKETPTIPVALRNSLIQLLFPMAARQRVWTTLEYSLINSPASLAGAAEARKLSRRSIACLTELSSQHYFPNPQQYKSQIRSALSRASNFCMREVNLSGSLQPVSLTKFERSVMTAQPKLRKEARQIVQLLAFLWEAYTASYHLDVSSLLIVNAKVIVTPLPKSNPPITPLEFFIQQRVVMEAHRLCDEILKTSHYFTLILWRNSGYQFTSLVQEAQNLLFLPTSVSDFYMSIIENADSAKKIAESWISMLARLCKAAEQIKKKPDSKTDSSSQLATSQSPQSHLRLFPKDALRKCDELLKYHAPETSVQRSQFTQCIYRGSFSLVYNTAAQKIARDALHTLRVLTDFVRPFLGKHFKEFAEFTAKTVEEAESFCQLQDGSTAFETMVRTGESTSFTVASRVESLLKLFSQITHASLNDPQIVLPSSDSSVLASGVASSGIADILALPNDFPLDDAEQRILREVDLLTCKSSNDKSLFETVIANTQPESQSKGLFIIRLAFSLSQQLTEALTRRNLPNRIGDMFEFASAPSSSSSTTSFAEVSRFEELFATSSKLPSYSILMAQASLINQSEPLRILKDFSAKPTPTKSRRSRKR